LPGAFGTIKLPEWQINSSSHTAILHNRIDEVLSELFQNSQRSGSTLVDITTTANTFTIQDNGHGLLNGIDGSQPFSNSPSRTLTMRPSKTTIQWALGIVSLLTQVN
jgi:hypothetical protein